MTRNVEITGSFFLPQLRAVIKNWGEFSAKMGNCDLEVLEVQADCEEISDVRKATAPKTRKREESDE